MAMDLTPERSLIFRITHVSNVPWILDHGVHCASSDVLDPNFRPIGSADLTTKRARRAVPVSPGGTIENYVLSVRAIFGEVRIGCAAQAPQTVRVVDAGWTVQGSAAPASSNRGARH